MAQIKRSKNKLTELRLVKIFRTHQIRGWRRNSKLIGHPDFLFRKKKIAVFVDGCFWHGCPLHGSFPKTNAKFWKKKLNDNKKRDEVIGAELEKRGWRVIRIWQHELLLKNRKELVNKLRLLEAV